MAYWRKRAPGTFDPLFHQLMELGPGVHSVKLFLSEAQAKDFQKHWRLFQYCLRQFDHPTSRLEPLYKRHTRLRWNRELERWEISLVIHEHLADLFQDHNPFA